MAGLKFNQDVDIAVWSKGVAEHRAEERELADMITSTIIRKGLLGNFDLRLRHGVAPLPRLYLELLTLVLVSVRTLKVFMNDADATLEDVAHTM
jgi:hypothetical protein